ncbi:MAG: HAMP domain-containing sensor histidine kinase [Eubacterium sp.]
MEKVKIKKTSLKVSFMQYVAVCLLLGVLLSIITGFLFAYLQNELHQSYDARYGEMLKRQGEVIVGEEVINRDVYIYTQSLIDYYTVEDRVLYTFYNVMQVATVPFWFVLCIAGAGLLFYKNKLKKPFEALDHAAGRIAENDLDFKLDYSSSNELGRLAESFEKMREALQKNNYEMWRQMEDRKGLNAAFSHDLRTPITVLKGQSEMLIKYVPQGKLSSEKITETAKTMSTHITRLENYVKAMNRLQKLEDIDIKRAEVKTEELIKELKNTADIVCAEKELEWIPCIKKPTLEIDMAIIFQIFENLLSNAMGYADKKITVTLNVHQNFEMCVADDGPGFSEKDLIEATKPFYRSENNKNTNHFGMGLNICKILCEKHAGSIELSNQKTAAQPCGYGYRKSEEVALTEQTKSLKSKHHSTVGNNAPVVPPK